MSDLTKSQKMKKYFATIVLCELWKQFVCCAEKREKRVCVSQLSICVLVRVPVAVVVASVQCYCVCRGICLG
jgi:hypothetical protein